LESPALATKYIARTGDFNSSTKMIEVGGVPSISAKNAEMDGARKSMKFKIKATTL
jgi:hypothetical protein